MDLLLKKVTSQFLEVRFLTKEVNFTRSFYYKEDEIKFTLMFN